MNGTEQDIVNTCLERLSSIHGTVVRLVKAEPVGGGCINHAQRLKTSVGDFFLKWNQFAPEDMFEKEAAGLTEMRQHPNPYLVFPEVILFSKNYLLTDFLPAPTNTSDFEEKLGRGIAQLHRRTADRFGFHHSNYCGSTVQDNSWNNSWADFFAQQRIWSLVNRILEKRGLTSDEVLIYEKLVGRIPDLVSGEASPSLIHGDLWSGNFLYSQLGPALIDPACYYADREMELGMMQLFGGFSARIWSAYEEEWPLPAGWETRIRLYQLYHLLNHFLLFGGSYGREAREVASRFL